MGRTASFLASFSISLEAEAHKLFNDAVSDLLYQALCVLEQRSDGDHTPDETPKSFPRFDEAAVEPAAGLSCWNLFEGWVKAAKRAGGSVRRTRGVFIEMQAKFPRTSAGALSARDAKAWIDSLITEDRTAFTVGNVWLSASKAVFNWAVDQQLIASNPFATVKVTKQRRMRERPSKTFTKEEASIILSACQKIAELSKPLDRAKRWVPLLCAYTGARADEMTQLRSEDVKRSRVKPISRI
jgi:hypothetical protein